MALAENHRNALKMEAAAVAANNNTASIPLGSVVPNHSGGAHIFVGNGGSNGDGGQPSSSQQASLLHHHHHQEQHHTHHDRIHPNHSSIDTSQGARGDDLGKHS